MTFFVAALFVLSTLTSPVRGLMPGAPFSLAISTVQESVPAGSDIKLTIKLTNDTNHDITLIDMDQYCDYTVEVRDSNGQSVPETEKKRKLNCTDNPVAGKVITTKLKPGEHHEYLIFPDVLFDMIRPDKYTVQVSRKIPKELGQGQVKSNTIEIAVTEWNPSVKSNPRD